MIKKKVHVDKTNCWVFTLCNITSVKVLTAVDCTDKWNKRNSILSAISSRERPYVGSH